MWSHLRLTVLHAEYRAERRGGLPDYKGSMLRGALGHALKELACIPGGDACPPCPRADRCAFGALFEPEGNPAPANRFDRPMPYILRPSPDGREEYGVGDRLEFSLILVGAGRIWLPWVIGALARMGRQGFGSGRLPFHLAGLWVEAPVGHRTELHVQGAGIGERIGEVDGAELVAARGVCDRARLHFLTPTDLRRKGQLVPSLDGTVLIRRLLRRLGGLLQTYGGWSPDGFDFAALVEQAAGMTCRDLDLDVCRLERLSMRQGQRHPLTGLVGRVEVRDIPPSLWPYLVVGETIHIGKGASFGMGRYCLEEAPA